MSTDRDWPTMLYLSHKRIRRSTAVMEMYTRRGNLPHWATSVALLLILLFGVGLRLYQLDADSLWVDEIYTATTSRLDFLAIPHYVATTGESHPPLLYVLTKAFSSLVGTSDFAVRLPAALLGSLSLLLAYKLGEMLWSEKEGLVAAFLLAINAYHVQYSQEARHYAPMVFLALLSSIFLLQALRRNQWAIWLGFALATSLNLYLHYFAFLVLPAQLLLAAWIIMENRPQYTYHPGQRSLGDTPPPGSTSHHIHGREPDASPLPSRAQLLRRLVPSLLLVTLLYLPWWPRMQQQLAGSQIDFQGLSLGAGHYATPPLEFAYEILTSYSGVAGAALLLYLVLFALGLATSSRKYTVFALAWLLGPFLFSSSVMAAHHLPPP
jgi:4-amino-4-deoxy-L-arabinose transferase-like glycosyltransferase